MLVSHSYTNTSIQAVDEGWQELPWVTLGSIPTSLRGILSTPRRRVYFNRYIPMSFEQGLFMINRHIDTIRCLDIYGLDIWFHQVFYSPFLQAV